MVELLLVEEVCSMARWLLQRGQAKNRTIGRPGWPKMRCRLESIWQTSTKSAILLLPRKSDRQGFVNPANCMHQTLAKLNFCAPRNNIDRKETKEKDSEICAQLNTLTSFYIWGNPERQLFPSLCADHTQEKCIVCAMQLSFCSMRFSIYSITSKEYIPDRLLTMRWRSSMRDSRKKNSLFFKTIARHCRVLKIPEYCVVVVSLNASSASFLQSYQSIRIVVTAKHHFLMKQGSNQIWEWLSCD